MGILYCLGSSTMEVSKRFSNNEHVEFVDFDYDDKDEEILSLLMGLDMDRMGLNIRNILSVNPYADTVIKADVVIKAYEELKVQIDKFIEKPYYSFLEKMLNLLKECVKHDSKIIAIGD